MRLLMIVCVQRRSLFLLSFRHLFSTLLFLLFSISLYLFFFPFPFRRAVITFKKRGKSRRLLVRETCYHWKTGWGWKEGEECWTLRVNLAEILGESTVIRLLLLHLWWDYDGIEWRLIGGRISRRIEGSISAVCDNLRNNVKRLWKLNR